MTFFKIEPPTIFEISDNGVGLVGWLAVDSTIDNHCCGGLRMAPDVSARELAELARVMTLKYGFLGLPHGGAKAGIICDEKTTSEKRSGLLKAFGMKIKELLVGRVYSAGPDMGTTNADIRYMLEASGNRVPRRTLTGERSGWYTSLSVIASARVAASFQGTGLSGSTAAIEGFGKVGGAVAQGLHKRGCKIIAISTSQGAIYSSSGLNIARLLELSGRFGIKMVDNYKDAEKIDRKKLLELEVDILFPCARHHSINADNVSQIKAKLVSPGANIPVSEEAEDLLFERGVLCVPDFIANSGGVLGGTMEFAGLGPSTISDFIDHNFTKQVITILEKSLKDGACPRKTAEDFARDRFTRVKSAAENKSLMKGAFNLALELYRHGMIPESFVGTLAGRYFRKRIAGKI